MKDRTLKTILMISIFLVAIVGISVSLNNKKEKSNETSTNSNSNTNIHEDGLKFKNEYEEYNNKEREDDKGNYFQELSLSKNNPMRYATIEEVLEVLKDGTGVIYIGYPTCPWCRNAVPVLIEAATEEKIDTIYYLNINEYKNKFAVKDGKVEKVEEEKEGYYDLLKALDKELSPFTITSDGKTYDVGEKRIYVPFVIFVKDGEIINTHLGTVKLNDGQTKYEAMTEEQHKELLKIYTSSMEKIQSKDYCDEEC